MEWDASAAKVTAFVHVCMWVCVRMCVRERGRGFLNPSVIMRVCTQGRRLGQLPQDVEERAETVSLLFLHQHPTQSTVNSMKSDLTGYTKSNKNVSKKYQL